MGLILDAQLKEADLIVLSKCELLSEKERGAGLVWLAEHYPRTKQLAVSAKSGEGLDARYVGTPLPLRTYMHRSWDNFTRGI